MRWIWLERLAIVVASLAVALGLIALAAGYFSSNDAATVFGGGLDALHYADQGDQLLAPGSARPHYDSSPPTSGPHVPAPVTANGRALSDAQLLTALAAGDVVVLYGASSPPAGLPEVLRTLAAPFSRALAAAGQAVILAPRAGVSGLVALAWTHLLRLPGVDKPALREFAQQFLGRGAGARAQTGALPAS